MAELPTFGSRLLILQCSELLLFQLGHWSIPTLSPNTRGTDCCDFHVTAHTCAALSVSPSVRCGLAVCSCPLPSPLLPSGALISCTCCKGAAGTWHGCLIKDRVLRCVVTSTMKGAGTYFKDLHGQGWSCVRWPQNRHGTEQPVLRTTVLMGHSLDLGPIVKILTDGPTPKSQEKHTATHRCSHCQFIL